jgi:catechol 2,3-dioxygenase
MDLVGEQEPTAGDAPRDPEDLEATGTAAGAEISPMTTLGAVHLTVTDLERSIAYYREEIGLELLERANGLARLGAGAHELLVLVEEPDAGSGDGYTGLYHFALLLPQRADLARWLAHAARDRVRLTGLSDHFVSEALYLRDPDGHGIEIYSDRPRALWEEKVGTTMTTLPLDVRSVLGELADPESEPFEGLPSGTVMGHVHLKVSAIPDTVAFYRDVLGFGLMAQLGEQAAFLAAGGYHHHLGANTWESAGASAPPPGTVALRHAAIVLPDTTERERLLGRIGHAGQAPQDGDHGPLVRDPSGNALVLAVA